MRPSFRVAVRVCILRGLTVSASNALGVSIHRRTSLFVRDSYRKMDCLRESTGAMPPDDFRSLFRSTVHQLKVHVFWRRAAAGES